MTELNKLSASMSFSWESLTFPRGHSEPVGVKWLQWLGWAYYRVVFAVWRVLEKHLWRSRHFTGYHGWDMDDTIFYPFTQKTVWVEHEETEEGTWSYRVL